jgi:small subunit ribosomal protein S5
MNEFEEKIVQVSRVSKKTKGGNQIGFSILVVVGDKKGQVGVGLGKGKDVVGAIKKGVKKAKKNLIKVPMDGTTVPFPYLVKKGAAKVLLKPAPKGSGVIAGGAVRSVVEAAGIRDISSKILGTKNKASNVYATFQALKEIEKLSHLKGLKLRSIVEIEEEEKKKVRELENKQKQNRKILLKKVVKVETKTIKPILKKKTIAKKEDKTVKPVLKKKISAKKETIIKKETKKVTKKK